jgi:hypothetical protein
VFTAPRPVATEGGVGSALRLTQPTVLRGPLREHAAADQRALAAYINKVLDAHVKSNARSPAAHHRK